MWLWIAKKHTVEIMEDCEISQLRYGGWASIILDNRHFTDLWGHIFVDRYMYMYNQFLYTCQTIHLVLGNPQNSRTLLPKNNEDSTTKEENVAVVLIQLCSKCEYFYIMT